MLPYETELKAALVQYGQLQDQKESIEKQIDLLRASVTKWLDMNEKTEYQITDASGQDWKIGYVFRKNTKINKEKLYIILNQEQLKDIVETSESKSLRCQRVVTKSINIPKAPTGV